MAPDHQHSQMAAEPAARYVQIAQSLKTEIAALGPNTLLPTENALAAKFGVSRITIRNALSLLERAGIVTRTRGRGTVVNPPKVVRNNIPMQVLEDDFDRQGIPYATQVLEFHRSIQPPVEVSRQLAIPQSETVGQLSLLRVVEGQIICFERRYSIDAVASRLDTESLHSLSVIEAMREHAGISVESVDFETEILPADVFTARCLSVTPGSQILQNTFIYFSEDQQPVETGSISYRVDRCKFRARGRFTINKASKLDTED